MNNSSSKIRAISLFSGGLDSCLAVKTIVLQGIDVTALYFNMPFHMESPPAQPDKSGTVHSPMDKLRERAEELGARFQIYTVGSDYIDMVRSPRYGYGSNINPCIDCKIYFYRCAHEIMKNQGAQFLFTGDVLGQRPMTQNRQMLDLMARRANVEGLVLRPLTAKLLPITIPEEKGWVDREKLFDIQGRGRRRQIALAAEWGIIDYPAPAGGCLLTDPGFSRRLKDLFDNNVGELNDIVLLKHGRHFRFSDTVKLVVGRDENDNRAISGLVQPGDILLEAEEKYGSPLCILRGANAEKFIELAGRFCKRYSSGKKVDSVDVMVWKAGEEKTRMITIKGTFDEAEQIRYMIK